MKKGQSITIIIPDRLFDTLWTDAGQYSSESMYLKYCLKTLKLAKFGLSENQIYTMLTNIYHARNLSMKEIFELSHCKKSQFAHIFCLNIRTLNYWIADDSCPAYIKLMFIRHFKLLNLGPHIYLESQYKKKPVCVKKKEEIPTISKSQFWSLKDYEQLHVHSTQSPATSILERTNYLKDILDKKM